METTHRTAPLAAETAALMQTAWLAEDLLAGTRDDASLKIIAAELRYRSDRIFQGQATR